MVDLLTTRMEDRMIIPPIAMVDMDKVIIQLKITIVGSLRWSHITNPLDQGSQDI